MAEKFISDRNLRFLLYEVNDVESLLKYPRFADHSREVFDMILDTAMRMGKDLFKPLFEEMDRKAPEYVGGEVKVHPKVREIMRAAGVSKEETIMIGDGIPDIEGANRCGIRSIACAYGYTDRDRLGRHDPTAWIESFADLRPLLDSL